MILTLASTHMSLANYGWKRRRKLRWFLILLSMVNLLSSPCSTLAFMNSNMNSKFNSNGSTCIRQTSFIKNTWQRERCSTLQSDTMLTMGKGDGKKKRKKQSPTATSTPLTQPAIPAIARVTSDSNISVGRQIQWARMKKAAFGNAGTAFRQRKVERTAYRKSLD
jgi:hypothetical protein